jgi:hypothetical protein
MGVVASKSTSPQQGTPITFNNGMRMRTCVPAQIKTMPDEKDSLGLIIIRVQLVGYFRNVD